MGELFLRGILNSMPAILELPQARRRLRNTIKAGGRMFVWDLFKHYVKSVETSVVCEGEETKILLSFALHYEDGDFPRPVTFEGRRFSEVSAVAVRFLLISLSDRILGGGLTEHNKAVMLKIPANFSRNFPSIPGAASVVDREIKRLVEKNSDDSITALIDGSALSAEEQQLCYQAFQLDVFDL